MMAHRADLYARKRFAQKNHPGNGGQRGFHAHQRTEGAGWQARQRNHFQ